MFYNESLQNHLETSPTVKSQSMVIAEWNMNVAGNIKQVGNYRFRPLDPIGSIYHNVASSFEIEDGTAATSNFYYNATDSDTIIDGGFDDSGTPQAFTTLKQKEKMLYSLEDCFAKFRPRSGINKMRYISGNFINYANPDVATRPRYYMADKMDQFKYWTSYRIEDGIERGIANNIIVSDSGEKYFIDDAAPYVVYKENVPANRVVIKMQTNVGSTQLGSDGNGNLNKGVFINANGQFSDPFYGTENQTTPLIWKVQSLVDNNWVDIASFNETSVRRDGTPIIGADGYVELAYGLVVPEEYRDAFFFAGQYSSETLLPPDPSALRNGIVYLVIDSVTQQETMHIVVDGEWQTFTPQYDWYLEDEQVSFLTNYVTELTNPKTYIPTTSSQPDFKEFQYIGGLRVVVQTMNKFDSTFDLIELSPRLTVDLSDKTKSLTVTKPASDLGLSGMPVGQLLAATGNLEIFDYDQAFFQENTASIVSKYTTQNIQIKVYDIIVDVDGFDYYVPIKTMYSEGFPEVTNTDRTVTLKLRDMFLYFESLTAPQLFLQNVSSSYAISILLDNAGFSNYAFLRTASESELTIPNFTVGPDKSLAEVLQDIAVSSQSAMFFDENNDFIIMSKNYMMPALDERDTNLTIYGSADSYDAGVLENKQGILDGETFVAKDKLSNIIEISSSDNQVYNDGVITYKTAYIQRSYSSLRQAMMVDKDKTWVYKPSLLWEVSPEDQIRSQNEEINQNSTYALTAIPLNFDLSADIPYVRGNKIQNNTIDFGEAIYSLGRYNGYFYANGEVIKYDAIQYSVPGLSLAQREANGFEGDNVWITRVEEYQKYLSQIPFNGKIYPTGLVRIYCEPNYVTENGETKFRNGAVAKHGRGQFGTEIVEHTAGLSTHWTLDDNLRGVNMDFTYLSNPSTLSGVDYGPGLAGAYATKNSGETISSNVFARNTSRSSVIKNFLASPVLEESAVTQTLSTQSGTVQASALVMSGGQTSSIEQTPGFVSYVYKPLSDRFVHFGTRMRLIGTMKNDPTKGQSPYGVNTYFTAVPETADQSVSIGGASGGIAFLLNPETNNGYYFEIMALDENDVSTYSSATSEVHDVIFYKVQRSMEPGTTDETKAVPIKLWGGIANILVDSGLFTGKARISAEDQTPVYDLSVEYEKVGNSLRFYLYINSVLIKIVDDNDPPLVFKDFNITSKSLTGEVATIFTSTTHTLQQGMIVDITGLGTPFDGRHQIISTTSNSVTYSVINPSINISSKSILSNVAKLTVSGSHTFVSGDEIVVSGVDSTFDGTYEVLSATSNSVSYNLTASNVSETASSGNIQLIIPTTLDAGAVSTIADIAIYNNVALFVRGASRAMFENIYALTQNYSQNTTYSLGTISDSVFNAPEINASTSFQKYALSGIIQSTYLSGIGSTDAPKYKIYYDEFGTIMREAAYFNVRYDKAYPALFAALVPTINKLKTYVTSGFRAGAYGAEFLIFNATDTVISLDSSTGNYLKINGITFTQQSSNELKVDDFFAKRSDLSSPLFVGENSVYSPLKAKEDFYDIKVSRMTYGKKQFSLNAPYVQSPDDANSLMSWMISKIMKPRKAVGVKLFAMPTVQLGDIVKVDYTNQNGVNEISPSDSRFVVYNIEYTRDASGPSMVLYLSEVK